MAAMASPANASRATRTRAIAMRSSYPRALCRTRTRTAPGPAAPGLAPRVGTMGGMRTIALEEHFLAPGLTPPPGVGPLASWGEPISDQLRDLGSARLAD